LFHMLPRQHSIQLSHVDNCILAKDPTPSCAQAELRSAASDSVLNSIVLPANSFTYSAARAACMREAY